MQWRKWAGVESLERRRMLSLSVTDAVALENGGQIDFAVQLSEPAWIRVPIQFVVRAQSAGRADLVEMRGQGQINAGETSGIISIGIKDDAIYEGNETFSIKLIAPGV